MRVRKVIAMLATVCGVVIAAPASHAATLNGKGYETGDLTCGTATYSVLATGFGAAFRVTDSTGTLVFHSGSLTNVATGETVTFVAKGHAVGRGDVTCTGRLVNPAFGTEYDVEFRMSIAVS